MRRQASEDMHSPSQVLQGSKGRRIGPPSSGMIARPTKKNGGRGQVVDGHAPGSGALGREMMMLVVQMMIGRAVECEPTWFRR